MSKKLKVMNGPFMSDEFMIALEKFLDKWITPMDKDISKQIELMVYILLRKEEFVRFVLNWDQNWMSTVKRN